MNQNDAHEPWYQVVMMGHARSKRSCIQNISTQI